jgi:hypothetical protein
VLAFGDAVLWAATGVPLRCQGPTACPSDTNLVDIDSFVCDNIPKKMSASLILVRTNTAQFAKLEQGLKTCAVHIPVPQGQYVCVPILTS